MNLKMFHLVFILFAIVLADMFGAWAIYHRAIVEGSQLVWLGALSLVAGLGLCGYALVFVRRMDQAHVS